MAATGNIVFDIKYRANSRSEVAKQVLYKGLRLRESDSASIIALRDTHDNKSFTVDVGAIEWIRIGGRTKKLRSPATQRRLREEELKFLLQGKAREDWTDPYLRSYDADALKAAMNRRKAGPVVHLMGMLGCLFMSLPGLATIAVSGFIVYVIVKMMAHVH